MDVLAGRKLGIGAGFIADVLDMSIRDKVIQVGILAKAIMSLTSVNKFYGEALSSFYAQLSGKILV